jgi:hypothetical protein
MCHHNTASAAAHQGERTWARAQGAFSFSLLFQPLALFISKRCAAVGVQMLVLESGSAARHQVDAGAYIFTLRGWAAVFMT